MSKVGTHHVTVHMFWVKPATHPKRTMFRTDDGSSVTLWVCNGLRTDGPSGEPALVTYRTDGSIEGVCHYLDGQLHDPGTGEPACIRFDEHEEPMLMLRFQHGILDDSPEGEPAIWMRREDGTVHLEHCQAGRRHDTANGDPAVQVFDPSGEMRRWEHWCDGVRRTG